MSSKWEKQQPARKRRVDSQALCSCKIHRSIETLIARDKVNSLLQLCRCFAILRRWSGLVSHTSLRGKELPINSKGEVYKVHT